MFEHIWKPLLLKYAKAVYLFGLLEEIQTVSITPVGTTAPVMGVMSADVVKWLLGSRQDPFSLSVPLSWGTNHTLVFLGMVRSTSCSRTNIVWFWLTYSWEVWDTFLKPGSKERGFSVVWDHRLNLAYRVSLLVFLRYWICFSPP